MPSDLGLGADPLHRLADAAEEWRRHGWVLIERLLDADETAEALAEVKAVDSDRLETIGPQRRPDQLDEGRAFRGPQFDGTTLFPYPDGRTVNRLFVDAGLVAFAEAALRSDDIRIYQSRVWSKYAGHTNYEQPLHIDTNHSLLPIRLDSAWGHLECFVYLHDVDETNGAPALVPNGDTAWSEAIGGAGSVGSPEPGELRDRYEREIRAIAPAGSVVAYRSDVWHRGVDLADGTERHILAIGFRSAAAEWVGFDAHAPLVNSPDFVRFASECSPRELALFGWPLPGHPFWTSEVLTATAAAYPDLDLSPWHEALPKSPQPPRG